MGARVLVANLAGASAKRSEDFLSALVADGTFSDSAARAAAALALSARSGVVENQTKGALAQLCGMTIRRFDRACDELIGRGILRRSQSRPYAPNRYELVSLAPGTVSDSRDESDLMGSDSWGSGAVGSPQPPSIEGAGAPATLLPSNRRNAANEEIQEEDPVAIDPLCRLLGNKRLPFSVWQLIHNPPPKLSEDGVYLAYRYLATIEGAQLPERNELNWPELLEFLETGRLERPGVSEALRDQITTNPWKLKDAAGDDISLLDDELAVWRRFYVRLDMEEE